MDLGVGETSTRDTNRGAATRGANGVISPTSTDTQRRALLPKVPADTWSDLDRSSESKESHKRKNELLGRASWTAGGSPDSSLRGEPCGHKRVQSPWGLRG